MTREPEEHAVRSARADQDAAATRPVVMVSNRGPVSFAHDDQGEIVARRGAGGLVSGIGPLLADTDALWIAAAMSPAEREVAARGAVQAEGFRLRLVDVDAEQYRMAYDVVCNATLWFVHHHLFELARRPRFDTHWRRAWEAYRDVNLAFAEVVVAEAPRDAVVLVQDYHLMLLAPFIRANRPDLATVHFSHTPFAGPDELAVLPDDVAAVLLEAMVAHDACGFHTARWAGAFERCCEELIGDTATTFVSPLAPDPDELRTTATSDAGERELAELRATIGDRLLIGRVDRIELSKNLLRGFYAYDDLLERYPRWRGRVVFGAFVYPSREGLPEYLAYRQEVESVVSRVNDRWGTDDWQPILFDTSDNYPRSVAALRLSDVLLVNPIRDGLNLVAKEGALLNERDGTVLLSPEAGAWAELRDVTTRVNPFDVAGTADALDAALARSPEDRARAAAALRARAAERRPGDWLREQLAAAGPPGARQRDR